VSLIILDPTDESDPPERRGAERLTQLSGMVIGLLDISKARGDVLLDGFETQLQKRGATVKRYRKPTFARPAPTDLRRQIAQECNAVSEALAD
jgi:hypothetical protein